MEKEVQEMEEKERQEKRKRGPKLKVYCVWVSAVIILLSDSFNNWTEKERWWWYPRKEQIKEKKECNLINTTEQIAFNVLKHT